MGSVGPAEILVVMLVALIVLGPSRLPDAARSLGKAVSEFRRVTAGFQSEVRDAFAEPPPSFSSPPPEGDAGLPEGDRATAGPPVPSASAPGQPAGGPEADEPPLP